jgi:antitoxin PrlF
MLKYGITFWSSVMGYALTSKSQVTIPKSIRLALGVGPGEEIDYKVQKNGNVLMLAATKSVEAGQNPFLKWRGTGILKKSTEEIMRETRGQESMR